MDATVLIQGESGAGKEVLSDFIHKNSPRKDRPFLSIDCGAIPENLLESELFGYEPGAFTGASRTGKTGIFEAANTGTLLLDEMGELPKEMQVKLLRVRETRQITRIGSTKSVNIISITTFSRLNLFTQQIQHHFSWYKEHEKDLGLCILQYRVQGQWWRRGELNPRPKTF